MKSPKVGAQPLARLSPKLRKCRQGKSFEVKVREAYRQGIVRYFLERGFEIDAAMSYRQLGLTTDMTGGGFYRGSKNPADFKLGKVVSLMEQEAINIEVFIKSLQDLKTNRERYRGIGMAAAVAVVAKELRCVPSWTDPEEPCCLEDDGAMLYAYLKTMPKAQWPTSIENARFIVISPDVAEELCRRTVKLTPKAISPSEIEETDDKVALVERIVRAWAYPGTFVFEAMEPIWAIPAPKVRIPKMPNLKKGKKNAKNLDR